MVWQSLKKVCFMADQDTDPTVLVRRIEALQRRVAELEAAQIEIEHQREQFYNLLDALDDFVHIVDADLRIVACNRALVRELARLGIASDLCGRLLFEALAFLSSPTRDEYQRVLTDGDVLVSWEEIQIGGQLRRSETRKIPVRDGRGQVRWIVTIVRDMTAQKQIEDALRENEERLRTLINAMPDIVCFKDAEGRWLEANDFDLELFELQGVDYRGKKDSELAAWSEFYSDAFMTCEGTDERAWQAGVISRGDEVIPRPDGPPMVFDIIKVPAFDSQGRRKGLVVVGRDVTERNKFEESLRISLEKYRVLFQSFPVGVTITDSEGRIIEVNPVSEQLLGLSQAEHYQRCLNDPRWRIIQRDGSFVPSQEYAGMRALQENRPIENTEMGYIRPDGQVTWLSVNAAPIPLPGYGAAIVYSDITARVQAEEALRQERDLSRALADAAAVVSRTLDPDQVLDRLLDQVSLVVPNDAANIMLIEPDHRVRIVRWRGYERFGVQEQIDSMILDLDAMRNLHEMAADNRPVIIPDVTQYPGWVPTPGQEWLRGYAGAPICIHDKVVGFLNVDSATPDFFTPLHADILSAFASYAAVALENARLFLQVQQELAERKRIESQFFQSQKMEAMGRLASGVAHDFNNHLTAINGYAELLLFSLPPDDPRRQDVVEICKAAERSSMLTRQLLAFSRKQAIHPQAINLNHLIVNMEKMLRRLIGEHIAMITVLEPDLWSVQADPGQIEQAIMNLVVNACDALSLVGALSGGRLSLETANVHLEQPVDLHGLHAEPGDYVRLTVSDNGVGMTLETISHLFEPFFTTKEKGKGTGLGLSTVYGVVKHSDGCVAVHSQPGLGSIFHVYLPRASSEPASCEPDSPVQPPTGQETILLVEDDAAVRSIARQALERHGYIVLAAENADQAWPMALDWPHPIHLLLTDVVMPGCLNGVALAQQLEAVRPEMQILLMSGYTDDVIVHDDMLKPGFLPKPFTALQLTVQVRQMLDRAQHKQASIFNTEAPGTLKIDGY